MFDLVTLVIDSRVVGPVVDHIYALVTNGLAVVILIIYTSVDVFPSSISPPISVTGGKLEALGIP